MYTVALQPRIHGRARLVGSAGAPLDITVETEDANWSYAVSFDLHNADGLEGVGEPRAVIQLEVEAGAVGMGCATADFSGFVDREISVPFGMRGKVYVPLGAPGSASHLVLRNVSNEGRS